MSNNVMSENFPLILTPRHLTHGDRILRPSEWFIRRCPGLAIDQGLIDIIHDGEYDLSEVAEYSKDMPDKERTLIEFMLAVYTKEHKVNMNSLFHDFAFDEKTREFVSKFVFFWGRNEDESAPPASSESQRKTSSNKTPKPMYVGERFMRECPLLLRNRSFQQELDEKGFDRGWIEEYIENKMSTTESLCGRFGLSLFGGDVDVNMGKLLRHLGDRETRDCIARYIIQGHVD